MSNDIQNLRSCRALAPSPLTRMKQNDGSLGHILDILHHVVKIQIGRLGIVVAVLAHLQPRVGKDGNVVAPGRVGHVNVLVAVFAHQSISESRIAVSRRI